MNIVLEGPDGSGKSTLAKQILKHLPLTLKGGEGPPKYEGEMAERIERYLTLDGMLFDRHPCVSQLIYGKHRRGAWLPDQDMIDRFYQSKPIFVYCFGKPGDHVADHEADTPDHLELIEQHDRDIRADYLEWASIHVDPNLWFCADGFDPDQATQHVIQLCKEKYHAQN